MLLSCCCEVEEAKDMMPTVTETNCSTGDIWLESVEENLLQQVSGVTLKLVSASV